jgi:excisionase family DNA binding protein
MNNNEFLTVKQTAELLQVHWQTILNYIKSGKLKAVKLGKGYRVTKSALSEFIVINTTKKTKKS